MGNNTEKRKAENFRQYQDDCARWNRPIHWEMDITTAMCLVGAMQLALRHPQFAGPSPKVVREWILNFRDTVPVEFPGIKECINMGMHRRYDE